MIKRNLVLIGLPGSRKKHSKRTAVPASGWPLLDTERMVVQQEGRTIPKFCLRGRGLLSTRGDCLRQGKRPALRKRLSLPAAVLCWEENMTALRRSGFVCFLDRGAAEIAEGLDISGRPLCGRGREKLPSGPRAGCALPQNTPMR